MFYNDRDNYQDDNSQFRGFESEINSDFDSDETVVECSNCDWSWDINDSDEDDAFVCHKCGHDNTENEDFESFDDTVFNIDFSEVSGDFSQAIGKVNRKIASKTSRPKPRFKRFKSKQVKNNQQSTQRPPSKRFIKSAPERNVKPLSKSYSIKDGKYVVRGKGQKKISRVLVPDNQKVIIQGASKFILSQKSKDEGVKNIQYYKGEKLKPLVLIINNEEPTDFVFELFNPSMMLDYLYSTSQNLNDRITVAGGLTSYSDLLFNILANPVLIVNAQITTAGPQVSNQNNQPFFIKNKSIEGVQFGFPVNLDLQIDNMQVFNDIIYFNLRDTINRAFIPDGMDVISYKVLAGMTVTITFWYKQFSFKKDVYEEARTSKNLL